MNSFTFGGGGGVTSVNGYTSAVTGAQAVAGAAIAPSLVTVGSTVVHDGYYLISGNNDLLVGSNNSGYTQLRCNQGFEVSTGSTLTLRAYANGGLYVGTLPTDPGAGNVAVQGALFVASTITPAGTTGNRVVNKQRGTVRLGIGNDTLVVTNSLVTGTSKIVAHAVTLDAAAKTFVVVAASGSFTIYANDAANGETEIVFDVLIF